MIDDEAFEFSLSKLQELCPDQSKSIHGPQSLTWKVFRYSCCLWGGLRAALLQIALPQVAQAIKDHSQIIANPYERLKRTFFFVSQANYGPQSLAIDTARRLRSYHSNIHGYMPDGSRYFANDETAVFWVHASIAETGILMYEKLKKPLTLKEKDQLINELYKSALLMGLHKRELHESWNSFNEQYQFIKKNLLYRIDATNEIAQVLVKPHIPYGTLMNYLIAFTVSSLDQDVLSLFDLEGSPEKSRRLLYLLRKSYSFLPEILQWMPPYMEVHYSHSRYKLRQPFISLANKLMLGQRSIIRSQLKS